jgi:hypothetical protein
MKKIVELTTELRVLAGFAISLLQFFERRHEDFRNIASAVAAEMAESIGLRG